MKSEEKPPTWKEASTLEEWVEKTLRSGDEDSVITFMRVLPEDSAVREKMRKVWLRVRNEKGKS